MVQSQDKMKHSNWIESRKILLLEVKQLIIKLVPCESDFLVANIEIETGLSRIKAQEALGTFFNSKFIEIKNKMVVIKK